MKKFLTFLIVLIVVFTFGLIIFRLVRNQETVYINPSNAYYNEGETISFSYEVKNKNRTSKITIESSDPTVVAKQSNGEFKAVGGGVCQIVLTHVNPKGVVSTQAKDVRVGDGTEANPYFVRNLAEFNAIRDVETQEELDINLSKHYIQTADITLLENFVPIDGTLTGSYRGMLLDDSTSITNKSYSKIIDYKVETKEGSNAEFSSLFKAIGPTGKFGYINFVNVTINGSFRNASVVCVKNEGIIDFVSVDGVINNTYAESKSAAIAIENSYVKTNQPAQIMRSHNTASITTRGSKVAGIVYENKANVLFCINGSMTTDHGKLTAQGDNAIVGGIVGENTYGFKTEVEENGKKVSKFDLQIAIDSDKTGEEKDALIVAELAYRPQVKDCYSTAIIDAKASENIGGIIGKETHGWKNPLSNKDEQTRDNLTIGNYYVIHDDVNFNRGVGNLSYTEESAINIYEPQTKFIAIGLDATQLIEGIETTVNGEIVKASLVSYTQNSTRVTWKDENVYAFYKINSESQLPVIRQTENYFGTLNYRTPTASVKGDKISNLIDFLGTDFTRTTGGQVIEYVIDGWIDFSESTNGADFDNYFEYTGSASKPAQFVLRAEEIKNSDGTTAKDEEGNTLYYGFKNLSETNKFVKNAAYVGIFGYIKNSTIENVTFKDCNIYAAEASEGQSATETIGLAVGYAENSNFNNLIFINENEETNGSNMAVGTKVAGGVVGEMKNSSISGVRGTLLVSGSTEAEGAIAGGIVGKSESSTYTNVNCITGVSVSGIKAGGFAGTLDKGSVTSVKLNASTVYANTVGGFAHTLSGVSVSLVDLKSSLSGTIVSAGVAVLAEKDASFRNALVYTTFEGGNTKVGLFENLKKTAVASNVVHTNNFKNAGGERTLFAKTVNVSAQVFSGDEITDAQRNAAEDSGRLVNCFVLNLVNGNLDPQNTRTNPQTVFYAEQRSLLDTGFSHLQTDSFHPMSRAVYTFLQPVLVIFGKYGAGLLNTNGRLYSTDSNGFNESLNKSEFGFSPEWDFSNGFPILNF